ncbi:MAG: hypothetical protein V3V41_10725 [Candidatus Heimdallarchaeota archaeon]
MSATARLLWGTFLHEALHEAHHIADELRHTGGTFQVRGCTYHYSSPYQIKGKVVNVKVN